MDKQTGPKGFLVVLPSEIIEIPQDSDKSWLTLFYSLPRELAEKWKPAYELPLDNFFIKLYNFLGHSLLSPFRMVCRDFILPEPASYVFFYAVFNLRKLLYIIDPW